MSGDDLGVVRVDDPDARVHLIKDAPVVETVVFWDYDDSDGELFSEQAHLGADDVRSLRDWHATRVDILDRELELGEARLDGAYHAQLVVEVLQRCAELETLEPVERGGPSPLNPDKIEQMRVEAVRSPKQARQLIHELDRELKWEGFAGTRWAQ